MTAYALRPGFFEQLAELLRGGALLLRPAPVDDDDVKKAEAKTGAMLQGLVSMRAQLEKIAEELETQVPPIVASDEFFNDATIEQVRGIVQTMRSNLSAMSTFDIAEDHPLATAFGRWVRPYNDALQRARRAIRDNADALERRAAEEELEEAVAAAWAARNPPAAESEERIPLAEVLRRRAASAAGE